MMGWETLPGMSQGPFLLPPSNFSVFPMDTQSPSCGSPPYRSIATERRSQEGECTVLTCKNDHVHAPEYAHDPAHHDDGGQDLDEGGGDVQPEDAAHVPVGEVGAGPAEHGER